MNLLNAIIKELPIMKYMTLNTIIKTNINNKNRYIIPKNLLECSILLNNYFYSIFSFPIILNRWVPTP